MSQSAVPPAIESSPPNEFDYKPVPVIAPVSLCLGICSAISLATVVGLGICAFGMVLGFWGVRKIRRSQGELGGMLLATMGFSLSAIFLVSGASLHAYQYHTEVPEGYRRINFSQDISQKEFVYEDGTMRIHPDVRALDNQKIFVKGYMYPTGQTEGLTAFTLVKDNQQCCFGGQPKLNDMILVRMNEGETVDYNKQALVAVAGVLRVAATLPEVQTTPVYELEGTHFSTARTSF